MSASMTAQLIADAFVMRPGRRGKPDALCIIPTRATITPATSSSVCSAEHGVVCSISRAGNICDNPAMEAAALTNRLPQPGWSSKCRRS
jgi:putative transposase